MTTLGDCAIAAGESAAGLAILDDAMCSVIAGELTPLCMGIVYCSVIASCFAVADLGRATEWTNAAISWCDSVPNGSPYHGICRVHRVEVTTLLGAWPQATIDARQRVRRAHCSLAGGCGRELLHDGRGPPSARRVRRSRRPPSCRRTISGGSRNPGWRCCACEQARPEDARPLLRIEASTFSRARLPRSLLLAAQVEVAIELGDLDRAHDAVDALQALATDAPQSVVDAFADLAARVSSPRDRRCRERVWRRESRCHTFSRTPAPVRSCLGPCGARARGASGR